MTETPQVTRRTPIGFELGDVNQRFNFNSFGRWQGVESTYFAYSPEPDYLKLWLRFVEGSATKSETMITTATQDCLGRLHGTSCFLADHDGPLQIEATAVTMYGLVNALFRRPIKMTAIIEFPAPTIKLTDLNVLYFANTTLDRLAVPTDPPVEPAALGAHVLRGEPKSRTLAQELATFLGVNLKKLGSMTGIGRTTFSSWKTKNPRASTLRDLYRLDGLIRSLRNTIGDQQARTWLQVGSPSPFALLEERRLSEVEAMVSSLVFTPALEPKSMAITPFDEEQLPERKQDAVSLRAKQRSVKGGLKSEPR